MLAQRLLVDLQLLGDVGLSEAESRSVLDERALVCGRHIFGWHFPFRVSQLRDARARGGKLSQGEWAALGRLGTSQGDQFGFLLAIENLRHGRRRSWLAAQ